MKFLNIILAVGWSVFAISDPVPVKIFLASVQIFVIGVFLITDELKLIRETLKLK